MDIKDSRILVTGGAGFIGSHIVDQLRKANCSIIIFDNMSSGRFKNIKSAIHLGNVKLVRGDITRYRSLLGALKNIDYVFHTAAMLDLRDPNIDKMMMNNTNVIGTLNVLEASVKSNVKRLINFSSAAVYGEKESLPISEVALTEPASFYGASKLAAEIYCKLFNSAYDLETVSLRLFNVYGPRQSYGPYSGVITQFVDRIMKDKNPIIFGDGLQTRDFIHVSDVVRAAISAASKRNPKGNVFNIGSGKSTTIRSLAQKLMKICGRTKFVVRYKTASPGDIRNSYADIKKSKDSLGFSCKMQLDEGLRNYVDSLK